MTFVLLKMIVIITIFFYLLAVLSGILTLKFLQPHSDFRVRDVVDASIRYCLSPLGALKDRAPTVETTLGFAYLVICASTIWCLTGILQMFELLQRDETEIRNVTRSLFWMWQHIGSGVIAFGVHAVVRFLAGRVA